DRHGDHVRVLARGELDISLLGLLEKTFEDADGCHISVDLTRISSIDMAALHVTLQAAKRTRAFGSSFEVLVAQEGFVWRILQLTETIGPLGAQLVSISQGGALSERYG